MPLFAYEMALNLIGMLLLIYVIRRFGPRLFAGDATLMYLMWYGGVRTLLETYRVNNWTILGVPTAMWLGILAFVLAGAWFVYRHRRGWGTPMIKPVNEPPTGALTAEHPAGGKHWLTRPAPESCPMSPPPSAARRSSRWTASPPTCGRGSSASSST